jgi:hypothetical protein
VLLDSGASGNFISQSFLAAHPDIVSTPLHTLLTVRQADGETSVATHFVKLGLQISSLQNNVNCIPAPLSHFDVVLGKPWLTDMNPDINWRLNAVSLKLQDTVHVLLGCAQTHLPAFVISALEAHSIVDNGGSSHMLYVRDVATKTQDHASSPHSSVLDPILETFQDILKGLPAGLPPTRVVDHHIRLVPGSAPPPSRLYPLSAAHLFELKEQLTGLLEQGYIRPSESPYGAPILFVSKKDDGWRLCVDYRALNKLTVKNTHPLPRIDEMFEQLHGAKLFTKLDLASGYHQVRMAPEDIEKTAFKTKYGLYEYVVMPFGLTNAPSTFQHLMNNVLHPYVDRFVMVYLDDILIYSNTPEKHAEHLRLVLSALRKAQLYCKMSKCSFFQTEVDYLGHLITDKGVTVDPRKLESILAWPTPTNVGELRSFLGLVQYYAKFVHNFAELAFPLTQLLKKESSFTWGAAQDAAFSKLKQTLTSSPSLLTPDLTKPFVVHCDASAFAIGCVLQQDQGGGSAACCF